MFKNNKICEMLDIEYPIIQGGMIEIARAELVAAVSNAGGMGLICAHGRKDSGDPEALREQIHKTRELTDKPFGVSIAMLPTEEDESAPIDKYVEISIEEEVDFLETSGRSPEGIIEYLEDQGVDIPLFHKVPASAGRQVTRYAEKAESVGAAGVEIIGHERGGHAGLTDITSQIIIPEAAEALDVPVVAGGGFCDAEGLVSAFALGAEGLLMGSRFMLAEESPMHPDIKEKLTDEMDPSDTMIVLESVRNPARVVVNDAANIARGMEARNLTIDELLEVVGGEKNRKAVMEGEFDEGILYCGQVAGRINEVLSAEEIINNIVERAEEVYKDIGSKLK